MRKSMVISVLGEDTPGLVESLSKLIVSHDGDWIESRMASLAGKFAGILSVSLPSDKIESFKVALHAAEDLGLQVIFEESLDLEHSQPKQHFKIELLGQDQPGIVHRISSALAQLHANVDELHTEVVEASMSGENLFKANVELHIAADIDSAQIQEVLENIANELIVDIELMPHDG